MHQYCCKLFWIAHYSSIALCRSYKFTKSTNESLLRKIVPSWFELKNESIIDRCTLSKPYDISASRLTSLCLSKSKENVSNNKMKLADSWSNRRLILKTTVIYKRWCWEEEIITKRNAKQTLQAISHTLKTILSELRSTHRVEIDAELKEEKTSADKRWVIDISWLSFAPIYFHVLYVLVRFANSELWQIYALAIISSTFYASHVVNVDDRLTHHDTYQS